jgi:exonuclease SbcD
MKIIHTSDWHLGQYLYTFDRHIEHQAFLDQLVRIVQGEQPDAMVVSGDIFHSIAPSVKAQKMYTDALIRIHDAAPTMPVFITAGNHDSASRLEVDGNLWQLANVHVIGTLRHTPDGEIDWHRHLFLVDGKCIIAAVPFLSTHNYPPAPEGVDRQKYFFQTLGKEAQKVNPKHLPVILMAHLAVRGCDITGHKEDDNHTGAGGLDYVSPDVFGDNFDYVALGHIHRPQTLSGTGKCIRYSGSPIPVNVNEDYRHSVTIVDFDAGNRPKLSTHEILNPLPLRVVPEQPAYTEEALKALAQLPDDQPMYVFMNVKTQDAFDPDIDERAVEALKGKQCRFCRHLATFENQPADEIQEDITPEELSDMSLQQVADLYMDQCGIHSQEFDEMLGEAIRQVEEEKQK